MLGFQNANFVPFDEHIRNVQARANRRNYGRRVTDFTDAVIVSEKPIDEVPEFADTVPMPLGDEIPTGEAIYPKVDVVFSEDLFSAEDAIDAKLSRARLYVSTRAFSECLHAGFFPPACQKCDR